ncbi:DNA polymerase [Erysipelothrix tonsillarum]|uniref:DNA polymerase n=1 Tax=Erysipelothrix tonsillarum TaxID=38402 RepID=UPI0039C7BB5D
MRKPHELTGTKKTEIPGRVIMFDTESYTKIEIDDDEVQRVVDGETIRRAHTPYLFIANYIEMRSSGYMRERYKEYYRADPDDDFIRRFWEDVDKYALMNRKTWVFAHNAKYDVLVSECIYWLVELGYEVTGFAPDNPFILKLVKYIHRDRNGKLYGTFNRQTGEFVPKPRRKTINILSSTNFYQAPLKVLGKIFGLPKLDFEHGRVIDMNNPKDREEALVYAKRDVEILTRAMLELFNFIRDEDLGPFSMTVAGQAFAAFRHRFQPEESIFIHSNERVLEVERRAYAGGRNECFRLGQVPSEVTVYDINSMYPHVMWEYRYPTRLVTFWREASNEKVLNMIKDDYLVVCDVLVNTPYPIYHDRSHGTRLEFPVGRFKTALTTPELIQGFERGIIEKVENVAIYEGSKLFEDYVTFFYEERLKAKAKGDKVRDALYKMFLTNLYGKFGQTNKVWDRVADAEPNIVDEYNVETDYGIATHRVFGGGVWQRNNDPDDQESFNSFPAIAAHVTGYARMLIWSIIETAGRENVYYTDTDSVFVNAKGEKNLQAAGMVDDKILGRLKMEKVGRLYLNGCKDYLGTWLADVLKVPEDVRVPKVRWDRVRLGATWRRKQRFDAWFKLIAPKGYKGTHRYCYREVKIKGIPKNAKVVNNPKGGKVQYVMTRWSGMSDRFKKGNFRGYENKLMVKTLKREYSKGVVKGNTVTPFVRDYEAEQRELEEKMLEEARKALEQGEQLELDYVRHYCVRDGYIRIPGKGDRYRGEYEALPKVKQLKYFRKVGMPIDEWADEHQMSANDLLDYVRG